MKKLLLALTGFGVGGLLALAPAVAVPSTGHAAAAKKANVTIVHVMRGCHVWFYRNSQTPRLTLKLQVGGTLSITNTDAMPHKLIKTSGPAVRFVGKPAMNHMSASVKVVFRHAGVYRFVTKAGEDYPGMDMKTIGEDNHLRLVVRVVA